MPISGLGGNQMVTEAAAATGGFNLNSGKSHGNSTLCMTKAAAFANYDLAVNANTNAVSSNQLLRNDLWAKALPYYTYVFESGQVEGENATCANHAGPYNMYSDKSTMTMPITIYVDRYLNNKFFGTRSSYVFYHAGQLVTITGSTGAVSSITPCVVADTTPPAAPTNLGHAQVTGYDINLSWTASTDNVGVTGYQMERSETSSGSGFYLIGETSGTDFYDSALQPERQYWYRVRAYDAANNMSVFSAVHAVYLFT